MSDEVDWSEDLWIDVLANDGSGTSRERVCADDDGTYRLTLGCIPGADAVQLLAYDSGQRTRFRCEIPVTQELAVDLTLTPDGKGGLLVDVGGSRLLLLPGDAERPLPAIPSPGTPTQTRSLSTPPWNSDGTGNRQVAWEVVLVIDGTARWFDPKEKEIADRSGLLLEDAQRWGRLRSQLTEFLEALQGDADEQELYFGVVCFGDHPIPGIYAQDLKPKYDLFIPGPMGELRLGLLRRSTLERMFAAIEATPGGDFVDALADALAACRDLAWTPPAQRKLVVIVGDSPGHSLAHPIPEGADALPRALDVDLEAAELHRLGVEILTLYNKPPPELGMSRDAKVPLLLAGASAQYRRLASTPQHALELDDFDPVAAAARLRERTHPIGRGASYPLLLSRG